MGWNNPSFIFIEKERNIIIWILKRILGIRNEGDISHLLLYIGRLSRLNIKPKIKKKRNAVIKNLSI